MMGFHVPQAQKVTLERRGWILLPQLIEPELLQRLQILAARIEKEALLACQSHSSAVEHACIVGTARDPVVIRYNNVAAIAPDEILDLLASRALTGIARDLVGEGCVPLSADIVYKQPGFDIQWHQDAVHPRGFPYLNVGVYLDDADAGDGCLRFVSGSHQQSQNATKLMRQHGWDIPGAMEQPAKAGDVLIHDVMTLHGSSRKLSKGPRRVLYIELQPIPGIHESANHSERWIRLRERFMAIALRRAGDVDWPSSWRGKLPHDLVDDRTELEEILRLQEPPIPANYGDPDVVVSVE